MWRRNFWFFAPPDDNGGGGGQAQGGQAQGGQAQGGQQGQQGQQGQGGQAAQGNQQASGQQSGQQGGGGQGQQGQGAGQQAPDWRVIPDTLSQQERESIGGYMKKYTSPFEMAKAGVHANARASKAIMPLGENPTTEEITTYRNSLKIPLTVDEYGKAVKHEPGKLFTMQGPGGDAMKAGFYKAAHDANMTPAQASVALNFLTKHMDEYMGGEEVKREQAMAAGEAQLRKLWPGAEYDRQFSNARAYIMGPEPDPALVKIFENTVVDGIPLNRHPVMIQWAAQRAATIGEGNLIMTTDTTERQQGEVDMGKLTKEIWAARDAGDMSKVQELERKRSELSKRLHGDAPIGR